MADAAPEIAPEAQVPAINAAAEVPVAAVDAPEVAVVSPEAAPEAVAEALEEFYTVETSDNVFVTMSEKALRQSATLQSLVDNLGYKEEPMERRGTIPLANIIGTTMLKVAEWCNQHKNDVVNASRNENEPRTVDIPAWDATFLSALGNDDLFDLICAANFLDIRMLMNVACKTVANMAKGKSPEELREIFGIMTDEEEAAAAAEAAGARAAAAEAAAQEAAIAAAAAAEINAA